MLTSLSIVVHAVLFLKPGDPITELQLLRELAANPEVMWTADGTPRFPLTPHLTSLESQSLTNHVFPLSPSLEVISSSLCRQNP